MKRSGVEEPPVPDHLSISAGIDCPPDGKSNAALQRLNERLEEEIKRVARLLHGEAGQLLVAIHLAVDELAADLKPPERDRLLRIKDLLDKVEGELRRFSHELRPTLLDDLGLPAAVEFLAEGVAKRAGLSILVESTFEGRLKPSIETALYRIIQESLNNAARHARAARIHLRLWREDGTARAMVRDDGIGFDL